MRNRTPMNVEFMHTGEAGPDRKPLTARQRQVMNFIKSSIETEGYPPTVRDIAKYLGIISLNAVRRHLQSLEKKGYIHVEPGKSRGIRIYEDIDSQVRRQVPIVGRVAAGPLSTAIEDIEGEVAIDPDFWGDTSEMFMLRVKGDSMYPKLEDGDLVIVRKGAYADPGEMVVALVEDEATVKILMKKDGRVYLHAINPDYDDIEVGDNLQLNGVVVGQIRKI